MLIKLECSCLTGECCTTQGIDPRLPLQYSPNPRLAKILDVLFICHADHELNCSTAAMRHLTSSGNASPRHIATWSLGSQHHIWHKLLCCVPGSVAQSCVIALSM